MKPEDEVKRRIKTIFDMRNIADMSRRTGYPRTTLQNWRNKPTRIRAVDLIRLEQLTGVNLK